MRLFGIEFKRAEKALTPVPQHRGIWQRILEPFSGAFQMNVEEKQSTVLCYPTLYACIMRIATDVGTLPFQLKIREQGTGVWKDAYLKGISELLRVPNHYQTAQQFREAWVLSKLINGNTYVLKRRDSKGMVDALYVLDPCAVLPMISDTGDVFYQLSYSRAENLLPIDYPATNLIVPASEIIHDRCVAMHHQLIGVPPICAAHWPAVKNLKILKNATTFFSNGASPGGILSAPAGMSDDDAARVKAYWDTNFSGEHSGKVAVIGADMKYTAFAFKAADSQLVEQMRYSDEQICQPFGIPPFIIGIGSVPAGLKVDDMANMYYRFALQSIIESMEWLLDAGLDVKFPYGVELDLEPLLRMDVSKQAEVETKLTGGGVKTPNEARLRFGLSPLEGGDTVYMQQQDFPLDQVRLNKIEQAQAPASEEPQGNNNPAEQAAATEGSLQQEALNGAQIVSLQGIILAVTEGTIPPETARYLISVAFPLISDEDIDAMLAPIIAALAANPPSDPDDEPDDEELETANEEVRRLSAELWQRKALESAREAAQ